MPTTSVRRRISRLSHSGAASVRAVPASLALAALTRERADICAYTAFAGPCISGRKADLELAPVMNGEALPKGLSRLG
jgi:hypothetical protein